MLPSTIRTTDYHTGGEPFRIVADPPVRIPGSSVADRRARAIDDPDVQGLRAVLCSEPRGHADMYGGFIVPPDDEDADLGVLFWHKDGFSTACGHGTIALGVWAVDTGRVVAPDTGSVDVVIDVPSGRVTARVHRAGGAGGRRRLRQRAQLGGGPRRAGVHLPRGSAGDRGVRRGHLREPARRPARSGSHAGAPRRAHRVSAARSSGLSTTLRTPCTRATLVWTGSTARSGSTTSATSTGRCISAT